MQKTAYHWAATTNSNYTPQTYSSPQARQASAIAQIQLDLGQEVAAFEKEARMLEAKRLLERVTTYDVEMIKRSATVPV